jgi:hypothetical protein
MAGGAGFFCFLPQGRAKWNWQWGCGYWEAEALYDNSRNEFSVLGWHTFVQ